MAETDGAGGKPLADVLRAAATRLRAAGTGTPELDARLLLAESAGLEPGTVHAASSRRVPPEAQVRLAAFLERRLAGEPVHRIIGRRAFYEHEFFLSPQTLEPRPDTETLVEAARAFLDARARQGGTCRFADLGTGTGAIAVSLLALFPSSLCLAVDVAAGALTTAMRNAAVAGVADRMLAVRGDFLAAVGGPLDLIVSNPPYIPSEEIRSLAREVREHDPVLALDGGVDGLSAYRTIAASARDALAHDGQVMVEIGAGQADDVAAVFSGGGMRLAATHRDLSGIIRVLAFAATRRRENPDSAQ
ncbi:peptide chain release factor N(5)-glutamine methyltransferase [Jiella sp. M17.18]|uniref:peptide chain release factor N(5)-glutamine methyltransferase n=1 Tax=Jiella sp. M17.18 TaxID=3234247 RepID=UPI0034DEBCE5